MKNRFEDFQAVEPLKKNRFLITFENTQIPCYLFRNFNLYNEGDKLIFETSIWETVQFTLNPLDIFNILICQTTLQILIFLIGLLTHQPM